LTLVKSSGRVGDAPFAAENGANVQERIEAGRRRADRLRRSRPARRLRRLLGAFPVRSPPSPVAVCLPPSPVAVCLPPSPVAVCSPPSSAAFVGTAGGGSQSRGELAGLFGGQELVDDLGQ
jgi:hypothetical protein